MMIDSNILHKKLNDKSVIGWIDKDKSPSSYKQGFLSGMLKALSIIGEVEYLTEHGHERPSIELDLDEETTKGLEKAVMSLSSKLNEIELISHSEKDIVIGCIKLMEKVYKDMIEYMEFMGFDYKKENEEERPHFKYSYFEIVQKLLLWKTSHSGGTSTMEKCKQLGFESSETIIFEELEEQK